MDVEILSRLRGEKLNTWKNFLKSADLEPIENADKTVLVWDLGELVATGSLEGNLLKCIAVSDSRQGEGLTASLLTALKNEAFSQGHRHLFLYTKPKNELMFSSLFFYPVAKTDKVLLMEDRKNGINEFLDSLECEKSEGTVGACVMNCNPFTLGHRYLIETAAKEVDTLYVFILSEDKSRFSSADRIEMARLGTSDLKNVKVLPTGDYLISSKTFPTYFLKDREAAPKAQCELDIEIFAKYFAPRFNISRRFVGSEPLSPLTNLYNEALLENLPQKNIEVTVIERLEREGAPISASAFRSFLDNGEIEKAKALVPKTTFDYIQKNNLI